VDDGAGGARALAHWSIGCALGALLLCGGGVALGVSLIKKASRELDAKLEVAAAETRRREDAAALLATLADELSAGAAELPVTLPEAPPKDPWGHPVRYRRSGPLKGFLTSAGPDGAFGTQDDVTRQVQIR
jgi:type II secretion system (T2SS) protein G